MQRILNDPTEVVDDMLRGFTRASWRRPTTRAS